MKLRTVLLIGFVSLVAGILAATVISVTELTVVRGALRNVSEFASASGSGTRSPLEVRT